MPKLLYERARMLEEFMQHYREDNHESGRDALSHSQGADGAPDAQHDEHREQDEKHLRELKV